MTRLTDEDAELTRLLRAIGTPEPPGDFRDRARDRYARALEARYRREAVTALAASALGLGSAATVLLSIFDPVSLIAWIAVAAASVTAWMSGIATVVALVPPTLWPSALMGLVASLLPLVLLARARSPLDAK
jgi:hypothetical protein